MRIIIHEIQPANRRVKPQSQLRSSPRVDPSILLPSVQMGSRSKGTIVLLALLLLLGNVRCVMACASVSCQSHSTQTSMPPCHQHNHAPTDKALPDCSHPLILADTAHSGVQCDLSDFVVDVYWRPMSLIPAALSARPLSSVQVWSPPGVSVMSSVLRL